MHRVTNGRWVAAWLIGLIFGLVWTACVSHRGPRSTQTVSPGPVSPGPVSPGPVSSGPISPGPVSLTARTFAIVAINDVYRIGGVQDGATGGLARVRALRRELERGYPDLLLLHAGDFLYPSLLSSQFDGAHMIDVMNQLDGQDGGFDERMMVTFGNHEFDKDDLDDAPRLAARIAESEFRWLGTDITFVKGADGAPLVAAEQLHSRVVVESGGVRVGLFSLTIDENQPAYVADFAPPLIVAREASAALRAAGAEVVVGLTHLRLSGDLAVLEQLGAEGPDVIIGGHEHNRLAASVDGRWVLKADADATSATVALVTVNGEGDVEVTHTFRDLGPNMPRDPALSARIDDWYQRHDARYCAGFDPPRAPGCLAEVVGTTRVRLVAEELEIRRHETNLGNWMADQARAAFAEEGAHVAFLNSGSMRLNQDVMPGPVVRRHLEELLPFDTQLVLLRLSGAELRAAVEHAVEDWTGNGWFMQVSGFAFRHDPRDGRVDGLVQLTPDGPRPIDDDDSLLVVTSDFLIDIARGRDGYTMLDPRQRVPGSPTRALRGVVFRALAAHEPNGIAPVVEGRICNVAVPGPCLVSP